MLTTTMLTPPTDKVAGGLSRKAILVALNASFWTARRFDKKVTEEVNRKHNADENAGRYNKLLVDAKHLKKLSALLSAARELHQRYTSAWGESGLRILPNVNYADFTNEFRVIAQEFETAADEFARAYPAILADAPARLNGLFNPADYPSVSEIRSKFKIGLTWAPVPEAGDFRSDALDADTVADIRNEIEASVRRQEQESVADTYRRIGEVVGHMAKRLKEFDVYDRKRDGKKKRKGEGKVYFKDSLVENVRELAALLPTFNLTNDPKLARLTARIETELLQESANELRDNGLAREAVQKSAEEIFDAVSEFMA